VSKDVVLSDEDHSVVAADFFLLFLPPEKS